MKTDLIRKRIKDHPDVNINGIAYYSEDEFLNDARRYIKAIKEGRMICSIGSVAPSGMSRTIKFLECSKHKGEPRYNYLNFYAFFMVMGFRSPTDSDYFRIHGCGMDMIFHTNYTIIHRLRTLGFLTNKQCEQLAQKTPTVI